LGGEKKETVTLPVLLTKFIIPKTSVTPDRESFRNRWREIKRSGSVLSGETFSVNPKIVRSAYELRALMPELIELNQEKEYEYISGRADLKYGLHADIGNGPSNDFLIKFNYSPSQKLGVRIGAKGNFLVAEHFLNTIHFILSEN
jgi:hypothetical protein